MDFTLQVSALAVFVQGVLSFFSPCVLPLLPVYLGYLAGTVSADGQERTAYPRRRVILHTVCFVIGVSAAFFLLGLGMSAVGMFFSQHRVLLSRIGGAVVLLLGLYQLGVFGALPFLAKERRLPFTPNSRPMSPLTALVMGFAFSFSWTPCIGPTLSSVLLLAASASSAASGFALIALYTLGFVLPFLAVGLFSQQLLQVLRKHRGIVRYTPKIGAALMVVMGICMLTGVMTQISTRLASVGSTGDTSISEAQDSDNNNAALSATVTATPTSTPSPTPDPTPDPSPETDYERPEAPTFSLTDQYGDTHTLEDYRGKVIFLNFWATWCPPCRAEMPDIQTLYEDYVLDTDRTDSDVVILGVAFPGQGGEESEAGVAKFLEDNGYTYPVLMDSDATLMYPYGISAFPTTFMIDSNGDIYGYVPGAMSLETMQEIVERTVSNDPQLGDINN